MSKGNEGYRPLQTAEIASTFGASLRANTYVTAHTQYPSLFGKHTDAEIKPGLKG